MNMSQKISYQLEISKEEISLVTKGLMGVLKERELEQAKTLGLRLLAEINKLSEERLIITKGALDRAEELIQKY